MKSAAQNQSEVERLRSDLARCERRLRRQVEFHRHYRERAIAAEQALGLYGEGHVVAPIRKAS